MIPGLGVSRERRVRFADQKRLVHPPTWYPLKLVSRQRCTTLYPTHITRCLCGSAYYVLFFEYVIDTKTCSKMLMPTFVRADLWEIVLRLIPTYRLNNAHIMVRSSGNDLLYIIHIRKFIYLNFRLIENLISIRIFGI